MADDMWTTMSIASAGGSTLQRAAGRRTAAAPRDNLHVGDILGATAAPRHKPRRSGAVDLALSTRDIEGAAPALQHRTLGNKPDLSLTTDDIDGAHARKRNFQSRRHVDPLNPSYEWDTPPRFLRDSMKVDDIEGAKPMRHVKGPVRDPLSVQDIAGATVQAPRERNFTRSLDVTDILSDGKRHSKRVSDPQAPKHTIHGMRVEDDPLSKPRSKHHATNTPFYALTTHMGGVAPDKRRHFRNTNFVGDIPGTTAGSRQRGLTSKRHTNPNAPSYTPLEGRAYRPPGASATSRSGSASLANIGARPSPSAARARRTADPRDAELAALRQQVAALDKRVRAAEAVKTVTRRGLAAEQAAVAALPDM
ncbi:unnamed protein product [Symbiodinium sp. KB8]|nr:unnamed protein product [Symbiodinium sp. KB8]